ncbi:MAG: sulfonate transport system ATP-binding protein [Bacillota bacterium]|jgi:NitT/TauT family transport system ATP-binding protein|nr:sulfonate transport system ATP-binding protein [Bacillota bacterium]MDK2785184.1 sulfonate transport system ATP-binding protein [Bacillota bacterium]MDK2883261.1 sulfonate transport system ATP-binding protein [Bacillota bacterium]
MKQVEFRQVSKVFATGRQKIVALRDVSFAVEPGEFWTIVGPSGSGKTTLLRCLAGLERPTSGEILVAGRRVTAPGRDRMMVFQDLDQLFPWRTVLGNILFALRLARPDMGRKECSDLAHSYLQLVGLEDYAHLYPHQLSGGMKQRVAIARALGVQPAVLLMDEPFASLDAITRAGLTAELLNIWSETRVTVIFVTHNIEEALITADHIVVLARGGSVRALLPNNLPRPRQVDDPAFAVARQRLHELLGQAQTLPEGNAAHERGPEAHPLVRPAAGGAHLS